MSAIVTGAGGFVGRVLMAQLPGARSLGLSGDGWRERIAALSYDGATIYHLAARVHRTGAGDERSYAEDNVDKTVALAEAAARDGAAALVFLSSAKVNGDESGATPFNAGDTPRPADAYARSKWAAEQALAGIASRSGLPVTVIRPPLVYGRGARANLLALLRLCDSSWPLPFASIRNRRSFVHVSDLARLLVAARHHRHGQVVTYMAAHADSVATGTLVAAMRDALGRRRRLVAFPPALLESAASALGQRANVLRLTRSFEVDIAATRAATGWQAEVGLEQAITEMVEGYREEERG